MFLNDFQFQSHSREKSSPSSCFTLRLLAYLERDFSELVEKIRLLNQGSEIRPLINFAALASVLSLAPSLTSQRNDVKLQRVGLSQRFQGFRTL